MPITDLPTPPSRTDAANFNVRAEAFLGALPTFVTQANALATETNGYAERRCQCCHRHQRARYQCHQHDQPCHRHRLEVADGSDR